MKQSDRRESTRRAFLEGGVKLFEEWRDDEQKVPFSHPFTLRNIARHAGRTTGAWYDTHGRWNDLEGFLVEVFEYSIHERGLHKAYLDLIESSESKNSSQKRPEAISKLSAGYLDLFLHEPDHFIRRSINALGNIALRTETTVPFYNDMSMIADVVFSPHLPAPLSQNATLAIAYSTDRLAVRTKLYEPDLDDFETERARNAQALSSMVVAFTLLDKPGFEDFVNQELSVSTQNS